MVGRAAPAKLITHPTASRGQRERERETETETERDRDRQTDSFFLW